MNARDEIQRLRDQAEQRCDDAASRGDRDSADAWEEIALALDDCQERISFAVHTIEGRCGLMDVAPLETD